MWCEKICGMHKNPINCFLHLIAGILLVYALWMRNVTLIVVAVVIFTIGHIIQALSRKGKAKKTRKR